MTMHTYSQLCSCNSLRRPSVYVISLNETTVPHVLCCCFEKDDTHQTVCNTDLLLTDLLCLHMNVCARLNSAREITVVKLQLCGARLHII